MRFIKRIQYNSPLILTFALVAFAAAGVCTLWPDRGHFFFSVYKTSFLDPFFYMRLFTHVLGHTDLSHYFSNFLIILLVGPMLEEKYGSKKLLILMAVTALLTGIIYAAVSPAGYALLGASGVAFMMMVLCSFANYQKGRVPITLILIIALYIGREIMQSAAATDNISHMTHIIGGLLGAGLGYWINREGLAKKAPGKAEAGPEEYGDDNNNPDE